MTLKVAEHFYSVQGEGVSAGIPSIFLRLSKCPLCCQWCDTVDVWTKGVTYTVEELYAQFVELGYVYFLSHGASLVITGGDPMLQQKALVQFLALFHIEFHIEVETQATVPIVADFFNCVDQWNISPKLANSGMPYERRINIGLLKTYASANSQFKFPVSGPDDLTEIEMICKEAGIVKRQVLLMPVSNTQLEHAERSRMVIELCKIHGYRYTPRLQLAVYNQAVGV